MYHFVRNCLPAELCGPTLSQIGGPARKHAAAGEGYQPVLHPQHPVTRRSRRESNALWHMFRGYTRCGKSFVGTKATLGFKVVVLLGPGREYDTHTLGAKYNIYVDSKTQGAGRFMGACHR